MKPSAARKQEPVIKAPKLETSELPVTDPRRKLSKDEWKTLTPEQKVARRSARRVARGPIKGRIFKNLLRQATRVSRVAAKFDVQSDHDAQAIFSTLVEVTKLMREACADIDALPDTFSPSGKRVERAEITKGSKVVFTAKQAKAYESLLDSPEEASKPMEVLAIAGKRVVVKTLTGVRISVHANHVRMA